MFDLRVTTLPQTLMNALVELSDVNLAMYILFTRKKDIPNAHNGTMTPPYTVITFCEWHTGVDFYAIFFRFFQFALEIIFFVV